MFTFKNQDQSTKFWYIQRIIKPVHSVFCEIETFQDQTFIVTLKVAIIQ